MITRLERLFFLYSNRGQRRREVRALLAAVVVGLFLAAIMVLVMIVLGFNILSRFIGRPQV